MAAAESEVGYIINIICFKIKKKRSLDSFDIRHVTFTSDISK